MSWLINLFKEYLLSDFLREKVSSVERERDKAKDEVEFYRQKVDELERKLDADHSDLSEEACDVLAYLFKSEGEGCDTSFMADDLQMEQGVANYHLDLLQDCGLAHCIGGSVIDGSVFWGLTPKGRRYVVERGLLDRTD